MKGRTTRSARNRNRNGNGIDNTVLNRVSPLPVISSPRHFQTTNLNSASVYAHVTDRYNVNLTNHGTPKIEPHASPAIGNSIPKVSTISDVRDLSSSRLESMKREMDYTYSAILKELEASSSRLSKRLKLQTQTCMQHAEEADREYKKFCEQQNDDLEEIQTIYAELIAEAQSSASRVCKTSIPEILHSAEKSLEDLRSRYGLKLNTC